jgi:hypothetical protein
LGRAEWLEVAGKFARRTATAFRDYTSLAMFSGQDSDNPIRFAEVATSENDPACPKKSRASLVWRLLAFGLWVGDARHTVSPRWRVAAWQAVLYTADNVPQQRAF